MTRGFLIIVFAAFATGLLPQPAHACDPVALTSTGLNARYSGALPLLAADDPDLELEGPSGLVELEVVEAPPGLEDAVGGYGQALTWLRPAAPLAPGTYQTWQGAFVVSASPPPRPELSNAAHVDWRENDDGPSFESCMGADCGYDRWIEVRDPTVQAEPEVGRILIRIEGASGEDRILAATDASWTGIDITRLDDRFGMGAGETCFYARAVHWDGELGAERNLGCLEPAGGGCRGLGRTRSVPTLGLLCLGLGLGWLRRRRAPSKGNVPH